ncbi:hypothetical protein LTS18_009350, partial [Coniosporium uncinatum]
DFATHLTSKRSFYSAYKRSDIDSVSYFEKYNPHSHFFTIAATFNAPRVELADFNKELPKVLARYADLIYADDIWDQRVPDAKAAAHAKMGLDAERGGVVVVRPDGYVGCVVKLEEGEGTVEALNQYFSTFVTKKVGGSEARL